MDLAMDLFLSQSDTQAPSAAHKTGFFAGLFGGGKKAEVDDDTKLNAFVLPERVPVSPSSPTRPDLFISVPVPAASETIETASGASTVIDVPMPSVSNVASAWQRLAKMTIGRKAKPVIPYYARATTEVAKPVARPAGRVNMLAKQTKTPSTPSGPSANPGASSSADDL